MERIDISELEPASYKALVALERSVASARLDERTRHLVKLRASFVNGCAFCIDMHVTAARKLGLEEQRMHLLAAWREAAAFSEAGLYLYVAVSGGPIAPHVADQPLFCGDAVELFVDADGQLDPRGAYQSAGTLQFVVAAPAGPESGSEAGKFMQGMPYGPWVGSGLQVVSTPDGYAVEALIGAQDLGLRAWQPAGQLGFDLAVDFAGTGAASDAVCRSARSQVLLKLGSDASPCAGQPWCDTRAFCVPALAP